MERTQLANLAAIRMVVGYLGEREQHAWWQSSFFATGSRAFLAPVFGRTLLLAQCAGVTRAAALVHDERIGVGHVYHLFRLPETIEQRIHRALHEPDVRAQLAALVATRDSAFAFLRTEAGMASGGGVGPIHLGDDRTLHDRRSWRALAAHYVSAFTAGTDVYPYFTARP